NELVAIYGNFVNRALQLTTKYWGGVVPERGELLDVDRKAIEEFKDCKEKIETLLEQFKFRDAQFEAMQLARIGNRYITECEPWKEWKTSPDPSEGGEWLHGEKRVETVLNVCLQIVANLSIAFGPFLPFSSNRLRSLINEQNLDWEQLGSIDLLPAGHQLNEPQLLFEKIDDEAIQRQLDKLEEAKKQNAAAAYKAVPVKDTVSFEDFEKLDIRVGHVLACDRVPKSKKLLQFLIDDGSGTPRTICSGIAQFYEKPEELIGRNILFVANFAPRKMMGIESQGMILSAVDHDETLSVVTTTKDVKPGSQVG
ncbi:MAG: methionine--tRNA ligase subunit beta, partial [Prevotella sp.]|nr:methionine--tRNA ligase subunit beta [Prevotella sp.]